MKILKPIFRAIISIITGILALLIFAFLIALFQQLIFATKDYIMSVYKLPQRNLIFIYELLFLAAASYIFNKSFRREMRLKLNLVRRSKKALALIVIANIFLLYAVIFDIAVVTDHKIIDYGFFRPQGKVYAYSDVVKIDTGIYGKSSLFDLSHPSGDFYYIIQLRDGTKIDLGQFSGSRTQEDYRFLLEKLDKKLVNQGIAKVSSLNNFKYGTDNLAPIYVEKIKSILENTKK